MTPPMTLDPLAWMAAAVSHIGNGEIAEAEAVWTIVTERGEERLEMTIRREVRPWPVTRQTAIDVIEEDDD